MSDAVHEMQDASAPASTKRPRAREGHASETRDERREAAATLMQQGAARHADTEDTQDTADDGARRTARAPPPAKRLLLDAQRVPAGHVRRDADAE